MTVIPGVASPRAPVCEEIAGHGTCEVYFTDGTCRAVVGNRSRARAKLGSGWGVGGGGRRDGKGKQEARQSVVTGINIHNLR